MQLPKHGANPHRLYESMKISMPPILHDFSENVNAFGLPQQIREKWPQLLEKVTAYPDPKGEPFLTQAAMFHQVSENHLFIGNGAAEIFALLAERYRGKKAILVHPTFSEYETTLQAKSVTIKHIIAPEETGFKLPLEAIYKEMKTADVLYLCTPNNPTGVLPSTWELLDLIDYGKRVQCDLVLDEAFIDFVDEAYSFIPKVLENDHLIIVRSMTKMYAIPGIRLGYVVSHPSVIKEIRSYAPHWNVNGIAAEVGALCFKEREFVEKTKVYNEQERQKMRTFLMENGCTVTDSVTNYLVFKLKTPLQTRALYKDLLTRGFVLRHTENFKGMNGKWLRLGIKKAANMSLLRKELKKWFAEN